MSMYKNTLVRSCDLLFFCITIHNLIVYELLCFFRVSDFSVVLALFRYLVNMEAKCVAKELKCGRLCKTWCLVHFLLGTHWHARTTPNN